MKSLRTKALPLLLSLAVSALAQNIVDVPQRSVGLIDALQSAMDKHPSIHLAEQQVLLSQGILQTASGQFDTVLNGNGQQARSVTPLTKSQKLSALQAGIPASTLSAWTIDYNGGVQREFRNGIVVGPQVQLNHNTDNLQTITGLNQSTLNFQITLPLFRGRGREVVAAQETSDRFAVDASVFDLNQSIAVQLATTAVQYWTAVAAAADLEIARSSENRGQSYLEDVRVLIDADRVPRNEINQLLANFAERTSNRIAAEQALLGARQNLALAMGLDAAEISVFPQPTDPMPDWVQPDIPTVTPERQQQFIGRALGRRADLLAARERQRAAEVLLPAARNQLKPQLNVNLGAGYAGLLEGTNYFRVFGSPFTNLAGPQVTGSVTYSFAPRNNTALGVIKQTEASLQQSVIRRGDVARNIASGVSVSMVNVADSIARLKKGREAVASYQIALAGEQEKYRLGLASLVDVLTMEDRLTSALSNENAARLAYATAIENLRYWTGTIIEPDKQTHTIEKSTFITPPFEWSQP